MARATIVVTQRERFGMTQESLEDLRAHTPGVPIVYVDGKSPAKTAHYLKERADAGEITLLRRERFLTPNQARNIGAAAVDTDYIVFVDNDVLYTEGWLDRLIACADETQADVVAPLTCQGLPAHTEIHHAGGDYAAGGDMAGFFANDPEQGRQFEEVMHGHAEKVADWQDRLERTETGMSEFHCALVRRSTFEKVGGLDEKMLSTKEHIDFCMTVKQAGGSVWFEPSSVITYVFPCRARPMETADWPFFALRWSNAHGVRSLEHFIAKWKLRPDPGYVQGKKGIYAMRRNQGILVPLYRMVPGLNRSDWLTRKAARASMFPERLINNVLVALDDRRSRRITE
ncbi:hypothetical protein OB2597_04003 [Pseudooceanicola batsensis HTCC2597]|uniref:Glycosyltransferase 2-like domain-containing protein n=1 Tax=Pseudooceanicola batsensis (strain ATCC BAA-863 / DSM 15984 / KCTC 12145 / HTCC2597) TaxID=252305 RepID=A3U2J7_PSEBH|nr:glycosyltransferase [Pseudooceanicola batsensis]EAQ01571.1 hypothetical protein OB2597_04003 [Pseudooceanicola batsensis HTCC2597]